MLAFLIMGRLIDPWIDDWMPLSLVHSFALLGKRLLPHLLLSILARILRRLVHCLLVHSLTDSPQSLHVLVDAWPIISRNPHLQGVFKVVNHCRWLLRAKLRISVVIDFDQLLLVRQLLSCDLGLQSCLSLKLGEDVEAHLE